MLRMVTAGEMESLCNEGEGMQALVDRHILVNKIDPRELFRSAFMKKFGRDMPERSLDEDVKKYLDQGKTPAYIVDFMIDIYGVH